jgi:aspartate racemase
VKRIGIVGGMGPESTVEYYRRIEAAFRERGGARPDVVVYGGSLDEIIALVEAGELDRVAAWLLEKIEALRGAGAAFAAIAANTPHLVFDRVKERSPLPLRSIVEAARDEAARLGARRLLLLGTRFTMQADFYPRSFAAAGMELAVPPPADQDLLHHRLFSELEHGVFQDSTRAEFLAVIERVARAGQIDAVILGCTEYPLLLPRRSYPVGPGGAEVPFLDTTAIHVADIVRYAMG